MYKVQDSFVDITLKDIIYNVSWSAKRLNNISVQLIEKQKLWSTLSKTNYMAKLFNDQTQCEHDYVCRFEKVILIIDER